MAQLCISITIYPFNCSHDYVMLGNQHYSINHPSVILCSLRHYFRKFSHSDRSLPFTSPSPSASIAFTVTTLSAPVPKPPKRARIVVDCHKMVIRKARQMNRTWICWILLLNFFVIVSFASAERKIWIIWFNYIHMFSRVLPQDFVINTLPGEEGLFKDEETYDNTRQGTGEE